MPGWVQPLIVVASVDWASKTFSKRRTHGQTDRPEQYTRQTYITFLIRVGHFLQIRDPKETGWHRKSVQHSGSVSRMAPHMSRYDDNHDQRQRPPSSVSDSDEAANSTMGVLIRIIQKVLKKSFVRQRTGRRLDNL